MRKLAIVAVGLALLLVFDPGAFGGLMILALPLLWLRGVWLFSGDLKRMGGRRR